MEIVIEISEEIYNELKLNLIPHGSIEEEMIVDSVKNGTALPKGHGRLIDADRLETHFVGTEQGTDLEVYLEPTIINAPTIIPEDTGTENV